MNRNTFKYCLAALLVIGFFIWSGWASWNQRQLDEAWTLQEPTEILLDAVSPGQKVEVEFHLNNNSSRSLRLLGGSVC